MTTPIHIQQYGGRMKTSIEAGMETRKTLTKAAVKREKMQVLAEEWESVGRFLDTPENCDRYKRKAVMTPRAITLVDYIRVESDDDAYRKQDEVSEHVIGLLNDLNIKGMISRVEGKPVWHYMCDIMCIAVTVHIQ